MEHLRQKYMNEIVTSQETSSNVISTDSDISQVNLPTGKPHKNIESKTANISSGMNILVT